MQAKIQIPKSIEDAYKRTYSAISDDELHEAYTKLRRNTLATLTRNFKKEEALKLLDKYEEQVAKTIPLDLSGSELATAIIWAEAHPYLKVNP